MSDFQNIINVGLFEFPCCVNIIQFICLKVVKNVYRFETDARFFDHFRMRQIKENHVFTKGICQSIVSYGVKEK